MRISLVGRSSPLWQGRRDLALTFWATVPAGAPSVISGRLRVAECMFGEGMLQWDTEGRGISPPTLVHAQVFGELNHTIVYVGAGREDVQPTPWSTHGMTSRGVP